MNLDLMAFFPRNNLARIKDGLYVTNFDDKKVQEHIGFDYLLIEMQPQALILLEMNIFNRKIKKNQR